MQTYRFTIVVEKDEDGRFLAICPDLQGCYTEGETEAEARSLIEDAIRLHLDDPHASISMQETPGAAHPPVEAHDHWNDQDQADLGSLVLAHGVASYPETDDLV